MCQQRNEDQRDATPAVALSPATTGPPPSPSRANVSDVRQIFKNAQVFSQEAIVVNVSFEVGKGPQGDKEAN